MIRIREPSENLVTFQNLGKKLINWEWRNDTEYTNRYALSHSVRLAIIILGIHLDGLAQTPASVTLAKEPSPHAYRRMVLSITMMVVVVVMMMMMTTKTNTLR